MHYIKSQKTGCDLIKYDLLQSILRIKLESILFQNRFQLVNKNI